MLISTRGALGVRCPACRKVRTEEFSFFAVSRGVLVGCSCGGGLPVARVRRTRGWFKVHLTCSFCESDHSLPLRGSRLWRERRVSLRCPEFGAELGFLAIEEGSRQAGALRIADSESSQNPGVMAEVLACLEEKAEAGHLFCRCGNKRIQVEVCPEKVRLSCPRCDSVVLVYAETQEDLATIRAVESVAMVPGGFSCIDARRQTKEV